MRILVTNDDGINAPGLVTLERIAAEVAGPDGEVWTVAPAFEQSGVGHCISYSHPTLISQMGPRRFAAEGSPADCVLAGIWDVMKDAKPDLILSGVNRGNNSAENAMYSGTLGAAIEGALQGIKSIALSQFFGPENRDLDDPFEAAGSHGAKVVKSLLEHGFPESPDYAPFYNVNFPPVAAGDVKGVKAVRQGYRKHGQFHVEPQQSPTGRRFLWITGSAQNAPMGPDTDAGANLAGYISVTPMKADLTDHAQLDTLARAIES